jgi:DNA-binding response OmpR family regulator
VVDLAQNNRDEERRLIIVEDDRPTREMLKAALERRGYTVFSAANGLKLISTLQVDRPALILLDIMLSWIDGIELCRSIKSNPEFSNIPVVFISVKNTPEDIRRGLEAGASAYFTKPLDLPQLFAKIDEIISK